jgi:hypothetical protein
MTLAETGAIQTLSYPRLSVTRLVELRALIDRLMALSPENHHPEEDRAMTQWRPPQPDLFMTPPPYDLPPPQRATVVKLLKVLLTEVISDAASASEMHNHGADNEQDHG